MTVHFGAASQGQQLQAFLLGCTHMAFFDCLPDICQISAITVFYFGAASQAQQLQALLLTCTYRP